MTGRAPLWTRRRPLTQKQWDAIQKASGLPDKARVWVEHALAIYAAVCAASGQPTANEGGASLKVRSKKGRAGVRRVHFPPLHGGKVRARTAKDARVYGLSRPCVVV